MLGVPSYGRGWTLADNDQNGLYCPATGGVPKGPYTRQKGIWGFYEILQAINNDTLVNLPGATAKQWEVTVDGCYMAPYAGQQRVWNTRYMRLEIFQLMVLTGLVTMMWTQ